MASLEGWGSTIELHPHDLGFHAVRGASAGLSCRSRALVASTLRLMAWASIASRSASARWYLMAIAGLAWPSRRISSFVAAPCLAAIVALKPQPSWK